MTELASLFRERPAVVTMIRSPLYTPERMLPAIECDVAAGLRALFGDGGGLHMSSEMDLNRTRCIGAHARRHVYVGNFDDEVDEADADQSGPRPKGNLARDEL